MDRTSLTTILIAGVSLVSGVVLVVLAIRSFAN